MAKKKGYGVIMARRRLELSEVIARKGMDVAQERMKTQIDNELTLAAECEAEAKEHRENANKIKIEFHTVATAALKKLGAGAAS